MKVRNALISFAVAFICVVCAGCNLQNANDGTTIFIYLCGSNLETKQGLAGKNIDELLDASIPNNTRVIVETGGSSTWRSHDIANDKLQRYEIKNKKMNLIEEHDNASMGKADTLKDFLSWGTKNYASKHNILVLWDHGGKSANKICYDENFDYESLDREQLADAFKDANLPFKFDIMVFDACYMAALENAALAKDYAQYFVASQEIMPSGGINYKELAQKASTLESKDLGKSICDDYLAKCKSQESDDAVELTLMDLSQLDEMVKAINTFSEQLLSTEKGKDSTYKIFGASKASAIYGTKSMSNLIDLQTFLSVSGESIDSAIMKGVEEAGKKFVVHKVSGDTNQTEGISLYFPFEYKRDEFQEYTKSSHVEKYAEFLKNIYDNVPGRPISFKDLGSISEAGDFQISLSEDSARYLASITYDLYRQDPQNPDNYILMGTDCEIKQNWGELTFSSDFVPTWPSLWGQHLLTSIYYMFPHAIVFTAPIYAAGDQLDVFAAYTYEDDYHSGTYSFCALWGGIDSNGVPSRKYEILEAGDEISAYTATGPSRNNTVQQPRFTIPEGTSDEEANQVKETPLEDGKYRYQFVISDILGNKLTSDYGVFEISGGQPRLVEVQPQ